MRVLLTGAAGFLGWHTRVRLECIDGHSVIPVRRADWVRLPELIRHADAVIHVAGVNRDSAQAVEDGNVQLANELALALKSAQAPLQLVFANSIQADSDTPYGRGKARASVLLQQAASNHGMTYVDVRLPNLFGEHGRPYYNSFVSTFIDDLLQNRSPEVNDRPIELLHAQDAAQYLVGALAPGSVPVIEPSGTPTTVQRVFDRLGNFVDLYATGDFPPLATDLDVDLFNTFRSAIFPDRQPIQITVRRDHRGELMEAVRAHGGEGQTFVSVSHPGITRGDHFHVRKVERFIVLKGQAQINVRRVFGGRIVSFDVDGDRPCTVDMPTLWAHNIVNTGNCDLITLFWTNELFDPARPDTYAHPVEIQRSAGTLA